MSVPLKGPDRTGRAEYVCLPTIRLLSRHPAIRCVSALALIRPCLLVTECNSRLYLYDLPNVVLTPTGSTRLGKRSYWSSMAGKAGKREILLVLPSQLPATSRKLLAIFPS